VPKVLLKKYKGYKVKQVPFRNCYCKVITKDGYVANKDIRASELVGAFE